MKKVVLYNNDKNSRIDIQAFVDEKFWTLIWNENGCRAIHDYLENLSDLKRMIFLEDKFSAENEQLMDEEKISDFIKTKVLEGKMYLYAPIQYWLFRHWDSFEGDDLTALLAELTDALEVLVNSSKNTGIWLYSKIFDTQSLKDQKKNAKNQHQRQAISIFRG